MAKQRRIPAYREHKQSGQGIVTLPDGFGGRRDFLLGKYGTEASRTEYDRRIQEWIGNGRKLAPEDSSTITINEIIIAYWKSLEEIEGWNRKRGDFHNVRDVLRILRLMYGPKKASSFGPLALKACRAAMIEKGWSRRYVNRQVDRLCRVFKWAASQELLPVTLYQALLTVEGLRKGHTTAPERKKIRKVEADVIEATLPFLQPVVRAMVEFQLVTGARPAEVCVLRPIDLDMKIENCWIFQPGSDVGDHGEHKTAHLDNDRLILIGPRAQAILRPYLGVKLDAYCFSPAASEQERNLEKRTGRKTPMTPSQASRRPRRKRDRAPGDRYDTASYRRAIARACDFAWPPEGELAQLPGESKKRWMQRLTEEQRAEVKKWQHQHRWAPNRLRHARATEIRRYGLDLAKTILGHKKVETTEIYAEKDFLAAIALVSKIG